MKPSKTSGGNPPIVQCHWLFCCGSCFHVTAEKVPFFFADLGNHVFLGRLRVWPRLCLWLWLILSFFLLWSCLWLRVLILFRCFSWSSFIIGIFYCFSAFVVSFVVFVTFCCCFVVAADFSCMSILLLLLLLLFVVCGVFNFNFFYTCLSTFA